LAFVAYVCGNAAIEEIGVANILIEFRR